MTGSEADPRRSWPSAAASAPAAVLPVPQHSRAYRFAAGLLLGLHAKREQPQLQEQGPWHQGESRQQGGGGQQQGSSGQRPAMCKPGNFTVPWGDFNEDAVPAPGSGSGSGSTPTAAMFTPYHVTTGGGEKYLLSGMAVDYPRPSICMQYPRRPLAWRCPVLTSVLPSCYPPAYPLAAFIPT